MSSPTGNRSKRTFTASEVVSRGLDGIEFRIRYQGQSAMVSSPLPGKHHVYPALAAAAVGLNEGMSLDDVVSALAEARPEMRMRVIAGPNGSRILDDSYNASPAPMLAALDLLAELPGRRIALLGEMLELGATAEDGHRRVGEMAARGACDVLLVVGERALPMANAARKGGLKDVRFLESTEAAVTLLTKELRAGDQLLIKGSRAVGLESVVEALVSQ